MTAVAEMTPREHKRLLKTLEKEARYYERVIADKLAQLGFDHYKRTYELEGLMGPPNQRGRRPRDKVRFCDVRYNQNAIYFRVDSRRLPYRVNETMLGENDVLTALGIACGRKVAFKWSEHSGAWFVVMREGVIGEIPSEFSIHQVWSNLPDGAPGLRFAAGVGRDRKIITYDLSVLPHLLIAGATGTGKSVFLNGLLTTFFMRNAPSELEAILVDLKGGIEFWLFRAVPHLKKWGVVKEPEEVPVMLQKLLEEIERREQLFEGVCRDLNGWNVRRPHQRLPRLLLVIDELAQVLLYHDRDVRKRTEELLGRILAKSRATGGHAILCTQSPTTKIVTGYIKANCSARMAFAVASNSESQIVIDVTRAKGLEPVGRGLIKVGASLTEVQAPMITDDQVRRAVAGIVKRYDGKEPEPPEGVVTGEEIVELAVRNFGGSMAQRALWDPYYKDRIGFNAFVDLLKTLDGREYEVDGRRYIVSNPGAPRPRTAELIGEIPPPDAPVSAETAENDDTAAPPDAPVEAHTDDTDDDAGGPEPPTEGVTRQSENGRVAPPEWVTEG